MASVKTKSISATKISTNALPGTSGKASKTNIFNGNKDYTLNINGNNNKSTPSVSSIAKSSSSLGFGSQCSTKIKNNFDSDKNESLFGHGNVFKAIDRPKELKSSGGVDKKASPYSSFNTNDKSKNIFTSNTEVKPITKRSDYETKDTATTKNKFVSVVSTAKTNASPRERELKKETVSISSHKNSTVDSGLKTEFPKVCKTNSCEDSVKKVVCAKIKTKDDFCLNTQKNSKIEKSFYDDKKKNDFVNQVNKNNSFLSNSDKVPNKSDTYKNRKKIDISNTRISIGTSMGYEVPKKGDDKLSIPVDINKLNKRNESANGSVSKNLATCLSTSSSVSIQNNKSRCPETNLKIKTEYFLNSEKSEATSFNKNVFPKNAKDTKEIDEKLVQTVNMNSKKRFDVPLVFSKPKENQSKLDLTKLNSNFTESSDYTNSDTLVIGMKSKKKSVADTSCNSSMEHNISNKSTGKKYNEFDNENSSLIPKDRNNPSIVQNTKLVPLERNNYKIAIKNETINRKNSDMPQKITRLDTTASNTKIIYKNNSISSNVKSEMFLEKDIHEIGHTKYSADISSENYSPSYSSSVSSKTRKSKFYLGIIWIPFRKRIKDKDMVYRPHNEDYCNKRMAFSSNMSGDSPDNQPYKKKEEETELLVPRKEVPIAAASSVVTATEAPEIEGLPTIPEEKQDLIMHMFHDKEMDKDGAGDSQDREKEPKEDKEDKEDYIEDSIKTKLPSKWEDKPIDNVDSVLFHSSPTKPSSNVTADDESCGMKCLYYTLQCCDCVII